MPRLQMGDPPQPAAPGPHGDWTHGSLEELNRDPLGTLLQAAETYGDVVRFRLGPKPAHLVIHLVRHPDHIHHVLQENAANYPKAFTYRPIQEMVGNGLVTSDGDLWKRQRRLIQPMFHRQQIALFATTMNQACRDMAVRWHALARQQDNIDISAEMLALTLDIVGRALFSSDIGARAPQVQPALKILLEEALARTQSVIVLLPKEIDKLELTEDQAWTEAHATMDELVNSMIAERHAAGVPTDGEATDLLAMLLAARDEDGAAMSDQQVHDEIMTFLVAGHETTASALAWSWYLLAQHLDVAARVRAELKAALSDREPSAEDIASLPLTSAVIHEAVRLFPPGWAIERDALADDEIGGYRIPAGTTIMLSPYVSHRHPGFWAEPDKFKPERFLPENEPNLRQAPYFPFGAGQRKCIGSDFAIFEATLVIANLAREFEVVVPPGTKVEAEPTITLRPKRGIDAWVRRL
ncbi:MAG: cytochrome P450 [Candidatus Dormiibacterota bacterium]